MRFYQNGPSIPDNLLIARDEGRVVFFCGAGVSRARAGLADFFGLAEDVIRRLGVSSDNPARKILDEARHIEQRTGVSGLISADRIFGLLERDFLPRDIDSEVAKALQPPRSVDLSAHRILLDLATTPEGRVRLVTTNFDRLFEDCSDELEVWQPSRLPDPSRPDEIDGIVHLHGRATEDYSGAEGDGFVLSTSQFGRAYLSEGWATQFFREIINRYFVVFVGYTADDPPVQYLLEALNKTAGQLDSIYALQSSASSEASARWRYKGIEAIAYDEHDEHVALWESLAAWAERAKSPEEWQKSVINLARKAPEQLQPHERGQIAHIVSTAEGARRFSQGNPPPPAEWLCVFDPYRRYAKPGHAIRLDQLGPYLDPFDLYGLDSDVIPEAIAPEDHHTKREIPQSAWDAFQANKLDQKNLQADDFAALRGPWSANPAKLASRLHHIGIWISKVAHQPACIWWAAHQIALHPAVQQHIRREVERSEEGAPGVMRRAWRYLLEAWEQERADVHGDWYDLKGVIDREGWDDIAIRRYAFISRAYLHADRNYWSGPKPPEWKEDIRLRDLFHLEVGYPDLPDAEIPDDWLALAVRELRRNLEYAVQLETELGGYGLTDINPIVPSDTRNDGLSDHVYGLSASVRQFSSLFARLVDLNAVAAQQEFAAWPTSDDTVFSRLRIWAGGNTKLVSTQAFGALMASLSDEAFWDISHQRDLLLVLADRWQALPEEIRKAMEDRLLKGPPKWKRDKKAKWEERRARETLNRITWLANHGCDFTFDLQNETERLRSLTDDWKPEYAAKAAEFMEGGSGWVRRDTEYSQLLAEPLASILSKAKELSGIKEEDFLSRKDPFAGLSAERPVRAFATLTNAARHNSYPEWAWRTFLNSDARKRDKSRHSALIAERISRYPNEAVTEFIYPASEWLLNISGTLASHYPAAFDRIITRLIEVMRPQPRAANSAIVRANQEPDWGMEAINAPAGKIAQALFQDPRTEGLERNSRLPAEWLVHVHGLLSLGGDLRKHAIVIFARNVHWLYAIDPRWTESNLLCALDGEDEHERNAFWSGFFWGARIPSEDLFMRMKPNLLKRAKEINFSRRGHPGVLAGIILAGWGTLNQETGERYISNDEIRDVLLHANDEFRCRILWQAKKWSDDQADDAERTWSERLPELLRDAWPRQKAAKTSRTSAQLFDLAFSDVERFAEMAEIVLPLLTTIDRSHSVFGSLRTSEDAIFHRYPNQALALLHAVLPDDTMAWPYNIEAILQRIGEADDKLKADSRLLELKRKWNSQ